MIYHIPSQSALPLNIRMLGVSHRQEPIYRPSGIHLFQWFYCVKGKGEYSSDSQRSFISEGQGLFISRDTPHVYRGITPDWTVHFIGFDGSLCSDLLPQLNILESGVYYLSEPEVFLDYVEKAEKILFSSPLRINRLLSSVCYDFLLDLSQMITFINPSELYLSDQRISRIIAYLENNYDRPVSLDDLAQLEHLSKEYLCSLFRQNTGQTIMHYLLTLRISRARIFLNQYPDKKVSEIAGMCGFESPSYFGKVFLRETGVSPEKFRKGTAI